MLLGVSLVRLVSGQLDQSGQHLSICGACSSFLATQPVALNVEIHIYVNICRVMWLTAYNIPFGFVV